MQSHDLINPDEYQYAVPPPLWKAMGSSVTHVLFYLLSVLWCQTAAHAQITFLEEPVNTTVLQDGRVSLRCVAVDASMRHVHVSWRKGADEPLSNRFHFDHASGTLSLSVVHCDDSGWYSCVASDGSETAMKRAYLTVLCGTAPSFARALPSTHSFTNVQALEKSAVVLCYVRGSPPPDVSWEKEGQILPSRPSADGPYAVRGSLYLMSSRPRDSGMYCCVAKNRLGTAMECTTVTILEETPPLWLSWWMVSLYCVVGLVVLLSVALCCRLAVEGCHRRKREQSEVQSYASEGVLGRRSAPAWLCESALQDTSEGLQESAFQEIKETMSINDETVEVEALEEEGSSNESLTGAEKGRTVAPPFSVEVVKPNTLFKPMMWYECWNQEACVQQNTSSPGGKGGGRKHFHSPHRDRFHSKQKTTTAEGLPAGHASPQRKVTSQAAKADKIRKSEGKDFIRQLGFPNPHQTANFPPVDMKLQLVEVGDDEDENASPKLLRGTSQGHDAGLASDAQTEEVLRDKNTNVDCISSLAPHRVAQLTGKVVQDSTPPSEPTHTSLSPSSSRVASLGSMSPTESQIDLQTDRAFSFLDDYDQPSDLAEEDGWGWQQGNELRGMSRQKAKLPFRT